MLTQIEWWGGLVFVVGALTYRMVMGALEPQDEGIPWYRLQMHAFYLLPAVVLAGYFYPLERAALQYAYLAVLGASLVMVLATPARMMPPPRKTRVTRERQRHGPPKQRSPAGGRLCWALWCCTARCSWPAVWVAPRRGPWCKGWCSRRQAFCRLLPAFRPPEALAQMTIRACRPLPFFV